MCGVDITGMFNRFNPYYVHRYNSTEQNVNHKNKKEKKDMRKPMVTRSILSTKVVVLCLNIETCEPFNKEFELPRTYKDDKAILKVVETLMGENEKCVHIVSKEEVQQIYGMDEVTFVQLAYKLDGNRHVVEDEADVEDEAEVEPTNN